MFNWLRAKKSMAEEIKNLRSRLDIERKEQSLLRRKLDSAKSELALFKRNRQVKKDVQITAEECRLGAMRSSDRVLDTIAQSGEDISRYVPKVDHERGFPYGALVSKD